jgi:hypothetical protein
MRKWIPAIIGLILGTLAGIWYGQQAANLEPLPWFAKGVGFIALGIMKLFGADFSGGGESPRILFAFWLFPFTWALLGVLLGSLIGWALTWKRHDVV